MVQIQGPGSRARVDGVAQGHGQEAGCWGHGSMVQYGAGANNDGPERRAGSNNNPKLAYDSRVPHSLPHILSHSWS